MSEIRFNGTELLSRARDSFEQKNKSIFPSSSIIYSKESDLTKAKNAYN